MVKKIFKKRRRLWNSRAINTDSRRFISGISNIRKTIRGYKTNSQRNSTKHKRRNSIRSLIRCNKGSTGSIEFILLLPLILFIIFGSLDYYITQMQFNHLENIKNYYTNVMKVQGKLTYEDLANLRNELIKSGFEDDIEIEVVGYNDIDITGITVYRNIERPHESRMSLRIKVKPKMEPFIFGKLLGERGEEGDDGFYFYVKGDALSEKSYYDTED